MKSAQTHHGPLHWKKNIGLISLISFIMLMLGMGLAYSNAWSIPEKDAVCSIKVIAKDAPATIVDQYGDESELEEGSELVFEGNGPQTIRVIGECSQGNPIVVTVVSVEGPTVEDPSLFTDGTWFRDITFTGDNKVVTVEKPQAPISLLATENTGTEENPEKGDVFSGRCTISSVSQNGSGGSVNYVVCSISSGILKELSSVTAYCSDHSAAAPYVGQSFTYTFTITSVDKKTGKVQGSFYAKATANSTDGVTTDSEGRLTGYQRLSVFAKIERKFNGYIRLRKVSSAPSMTSSNSLYSLDGATYRIYENKDCTKSAGYDDLVTVSGTYVKSEPIAAGIYYVKETKASKGFKLSDKVYKVEVLPDETTDIGLEIDDRVVVTEDPFHNPSKFIIGKLDDDSGEGWAQGNSSLQDARYKVEYYDAQHTTVANAQNSGSPKRQWTFSTDSNGKINMCDESYLVSGTLYKDDDGNIIFPLGTYVIYETQASRGYLLSNEKRLIRIIKDPDSDDAIFKGNVVKGSTIPGSGSTYSSYANVVDMREPPLKGSLKVEKNDSETGAALQGDSKFAETTFEIRNLSKNAILYEGKKIEPSGIICTLVVPEGSNEISMASKSLPFGTYSALETKAGEGFLVSETKPKIFDITEDGEIHSFTGDESFKNEVQKGHASIKKKDRFSDDGLAQGDATLEGTEFQIENRSANAIFYKGSIVPKGSIVDTIQTNELGICPKVELPYGTYSIRETKASTGYLLTDSQPREFKIRKNDDLIELEFSNDPIRGSLKLEKRDIETKEMSPQGRATFESTRFEVANLSKSKVVINGQTYEPNSICSVFYTNKDGIASLAEGTLPYGTYSLRETSPSRGYLLTDSEERTFTIRKDGEIAFYGRAEVDGTSKKGDAFYNQVMREDLSFVKVRGGSFEHLSDIPFEIVSKTTGERHVLVTDENGEARTEASWNPHTRNTNANDDASEQELDRYAGVWWGITQNGVNAIPDDDLCALPFDEYILRELPVGKNQKFELLEFEFTVARDGQTINLGTLENNAPDIDPNPAISTTATDAKDGDKLAYASSTCKLADQVSYMNLVAGETYKLHASLIDTRTLQQIPDAEAFVEFIPESQFGSVVATIECDVLSVAGRDVVFFEELIYEDEVICAHEDADDPSQRVTIIKPEVETYAHDSHDNDKTVVADTGSSITDEVHIKNLEPNVTYTLFGIVMDSDANLPAIVKNESRQASISNEEVASFWNGLLSLLGADSSTSEKSYACDIPYSSKIEMGKIDQYLSENQKVVDSIDIVSKEFVATSASMTTSLDYPIPSTQLEGNHVIFDLLLNGDTVVAVHADTANADQSFEIVQPQIKTTATDKTDGDHNILPSKESKVIDLVEYSGLVTGAEYTISGTLMRKKDGKALYVNDKLVEASTTFTPNESSGSVEVCFEFDASSLDEGTDLVAYEYLRKDGRAIADHTDIDDDGQTVQVNLITTEEQTIPSGIIPTGGMYYKTGFISTESSAHMLAILSAIAFGCYVYRKRIRRIRHPAHPRYECAS